MKIDPSGIQRLLGAYKVEKPSAPKSKQQSGQTDEVRLSSSAQVFHAAYKAAMESADIRTVKVERIKAVYDAGQYNINASKVADSIMEHALGKKQV